MIKDKEKRKEYNKQYQRIWRKEHKERVKEINKKSESRQERKDYKKNWQKTSPKYKEIRKRYNKSEKGKEYFKEWNKNNQEKLKEKYKKYSKTFKGIVNTLKKRDNIKFGFFSKTLTIDLIKKINERDKSCPYCGKDLTNINTEYDHVNPFLPISDINVVKCCEECNRSKSSANVLEWCKFMKYSPLTIVFELLEKQKNKDIIPSPI
jgi:DNA repair exonuclease SbcCD ATPase subunit